MIREKNKSKNVELFKKSVRGITLIALVVTIIVLLILAGVAISLTIGQDGIFARAQNAVNVYEQASLNEQNALDGLAGLMDEYINGSNQSNAKTVVQAFKDGELQIGDYVNYQNPTSGQYVSYGTKNGIADQTFTVDSTTQWIVLGLSADGNHLLLTTSSPLKRGTAQNPNTSNGYDSGEIETMNTDYYYYLHGAEGAYYATDNAQGEGELDNISAIYKNDIADEARSMTADDINNLLDLTVVYEGANVGVYKKSDTSYTTNYDDLGVLGETYVYRTERNDATPGSSLGLESVPAEYYTEGIKGTAYYFNYGDDSNINTEIGITQEMYDAIFKDTYDYDSKPYWLASPGVNVVSSLAGFGPGAVDGGGAGPGYDLFRSNGYEGGGGFGVRPVVSLRSNVTVEQLQEITGSTDSDWPGHGNGNVGGGPS